MTEREEGSSPPWAVQDVAGLAVSRRLFRRFVSKNTRFRLYVRMLDTPGISELYVRARGRLRHRRIRPETRLVIEAFPSSGNTFCLQALLAANEDLERNDICSHTHSPRVVHRAVKAGVPCIVVIRDPRDAVSSMVQRFGVHLDSAFEYYQHYYRRLHPVRDEIVVAPFEKMISDFPAIVRECNEKYGVDFRYREETPEALSETVIRRIEQVSRERHGGRILEAKISRPSSARQPSAVFLRGINGREREAMEGAITVWRDFTRPPTGSSAPAS